MTPKEFTAGLEVLQKLGADTGPWSFVDYYDGVPSKWSNLEGNYSTPIDDDHRWLIGALSEQIWKRGWWVEPEEHTVDGVAVTWYRCHDRGGMPLFTTPAACMTAALDGEGE